MLLKSLVIIGAILGLLLATIGTSIPWLFPNIFTPDQKVIKEVSSLTASTEKHQSYNGWNGCTTENLDFWQSETFFICCITSEQMHRVLVHYFLGIAVTPAVFSLEGTLLVLIKLQVEFSIQTWISYYCKDDTCFHFVPFLCFHTRSSSKNQRLILSEMSLSPVCSSYDRMLRVFAGWTRS